MVTHTIQSEGVNASPDEPGWPYMPFRYYVIVDGRWVESGDLVIGWERNAGGTIWKAYRYHSINSNYTQNLTCIPTKNNLYIPKLEMQELTGNPVLLDETLGYPRITYAGDSRRYARPKSKTAPFLEDVIANIKNQYNLTRLEYPNTIIFKDTGLQVEYSYTETIEDAFDERNMEITSWGLSSPSWSLIGETGYMNSVSFRGTNPCGSYSLFVPKTWLLDALERYLEEKVISWTFEADPGIHTDGQKWFLVDITSEHMIEGDVLDPSTGLYIPSHFGGNFLLAKNDGAILAKDRKEIDHLLETGENSIDLPENAIARTLICWVEGDGLTSKWTRVEDFTESFDTDQHYRIEDNVLYFGDGIHGALPVGKNVHIETYVDEIAYTKIYASGIIVVPYDASLIGNKIHVILKYYNVPSSYYEITSPITQYECEYWSKPTIGGYDLGSGSWGPEHVLHTPFGTVSRGRYLPSQVPLPSAYLSP